MLKYIHVYIHVPLCYFFAMVNSENPINSSNLMTRFTEEFSLLDFSLVGEIGEQEVVQA